MDVLTASDFEVSVYQATIFTPDQEFSTAKVMKRFYPKWSELFDDDPELVPSLPAFPIDIPRVTLRNKLGSYRLEIAAARTNFFWRRTEEDQLTADKFYDEAIRVLCDYQELIDCRVGRFAAVVTRFAQHDNPGLFLARHFCKESWSEAPLDRPGNFELHSHKQFVMANQFNVNSWVRNKSGYLTKKDTRTRIILVEQDINTLAEESSDVTFDPAEVRVFFQRTVPEFDTILQLYYPSSGN